MSSFSKVARKPRLTLGSAISNAGVVTVSELVGASHCLALVFVLDDMNVQLRCSKH